MGATIARRPCQCPCQCPCHSLPARILNSRTRTDVDVDASPREPHENGSGNVSEKKDALGSGQFFVYRTWMSSVVSFHVTPLPVSCSMLSRKRGGPKGTTDVLSQMHSGDYQYELKEECDVPARYLSPAFQGFEAGIAALQAISGSLRSIRLSQIRN